MLKFVKIKDPSSKLDFLSEFHPEKTAFICSDIKNKQLLESHLLKKYNALPGNSVLRANEFYKILFTSLNKKWNLRSDAFVKQLLSQFLESQKNTKHLILSEVFFKWFQFCFTFFLQDTACSLFKEWFYSKKQNLFPKEWLKLFEKFFKLLESQNILYESGLKVFLSNEVSSFNASSFEKETLIVDLAFSMELCEKDLFKELSQFKKVYILAPVLKFNFLFENKGYDFYSEWEKELDKKNIINLKPLSESFPDFSVDSQGFSITSPDSLRDSCKKIYKCRNGGVRRDNGGIENDGTRRLDSKAFPVSSPESSKIPQSSVTSSQNPSFFQIENRTQNQEVQQAVWQVSRWLKQGASPEEIVIYVPNIEDIWFSLKYHLERQSIPYRKTNSTSLIEFREIKYLLSALRFYLNLFEFQDLETFYFYKNSKKGFTQLKQKHFEVLKRDKIQKSSSKVRDSKQLVSGFDFVEWVFSFWSSDFSKKAESSFLQILKKLLMKNQLSYQAWLSLLELEVLSKDIELEKESSFGISCLSFNAFHSVKSSYVILLGLNESSFKDSFLLGEDSLSSLLNDLGFSLDMKLPHQKEKSLLWFLQSSHHREIYLSHYLYDLEGNTQGKALIFMFLQQFYSLKSKSFTGNKSSKLFEHSNWEYSNKEGLDQTQVKIQDSSKIQGFLNKEKQENLDLSRDSCLPCDSRLLRHSFEGRNLTQTGKLKQDEYSSKIQDSLSKTSPQQSHFNQRKQRNIKQSNTHLTKAQILKTLLKDKNQKQISAIEKAFFKSKTPYFHPELKSLSVSQLRTYADCPFKYAADKLFLIKEETALQQELSPLIKGKTVHELFNKILAEYPDLDLTKKQKEDLIDEMIPDKEHFVSKKEQIILLKEYLNYLIDLFLLKEQEQRADYPSIKPLAFEAGLKAFWDQKKGELSSKGEYLFKGNIDRIDQDQTNQTYIVRDYKASLNQLTHISSWIKKEQIQLLFYAQALEKGLVEGLASAEVSALFYSAYNEEFKAKGYVEKESKLKKLIEGQKNSYMKPREELMTAIEAVNKKTQELVSQIEQGEFSPQPKKKDLCQSCSYKNLCRVESYV